MISAYLALVFISVTSAPHSILDFISQSWTTTASLFRVPSSRRLNILAVLFLCRWKQSMSEPEPLYSVYTNVMGTLHRFEGWYWNIPAYSAFQVDFSLFNKNTPLTRLRDYEWIFINISCLSLFCFVQIIKCMQILNKHLNEPEIFVL